jgi:hypothetical protein
MYMREEGYRRGEWRRGVAYTAVSAEGRWLAEWVEEGVGDEMTKATMVLWNSQPRRRRCFE